MTIAVDLGRKAQNQPTKDPTGLEFGAEKGSGLTLVWQVRSSVKGTGQTLVQQVRISEKGMGRTLVWQVRRKARAEPWFGRFGGRNGLNPGLAGSYFRERT